VLRSAAVRPSSGRRQLHERSPNQAAVPAVPGSREACDGSLDQAGLARGRGGDHDRGRASRATMQGDVPEPCPGGRVAVDHAGPVRCVESQRGRGAREEPRAPSVIPASRAAPARPRSRRLPAIRAAQRAFLSRVLMAVRVLCRCSHRRPGAPGRPTWAGVVWKPVPLSLSQFPETFSS
jgi:hypothetical protein